MNPTITTTAALRALEELEAAVRRFQGRRIAEGYRWLVAFRPDWPTAVFRIHDHRGVNRWWTRTWVSFGGQTPIMLDVGHGILRLAQELCQATDPRRVGLIVTHDGYSLGLEPAAPALFYDFTASIDVTWLGVPLAMFPTWVRGLRGGDYFPPGQERDTRPARWWDRTTGGQLVAFYEGPEHWGGL